MFLVQLTVLLVYSIFKAFLPLPSLEVVLIPFIIEYPDYWILASLIGGVGTLIGGGIGYCIAYFIGKKAYESFFSDEEIQNGMVLIQKYGILAIFIGGITPIPDFLLAYLAGFTRMNFIAFSLTDGISRFLRSLLVGYGILTLGAVIDFSEWGTILSLCIVGYMLLKYGLKKATI